MGCSSSRKITIDNTDLNILKVSNQVIDRLRAETDGGKKGKQSPLDEETQKAVDKALEYWKERIDRIKANQEIVNTRLQDQYDRTYKEYEDLIPVIPKKKGGPPELKKLQAALIKCYKANQKKSLNCATEVENFNNWFENYRDQKKEEKAQAKA